jgi:protein phosphatase
VDEVPDQAPVTAGDLEEVTLPSSVQPPEPLAPGAVVGPAGGLRIVRHVAARGRTNLYEATWTDEAGQTVDVEVREGPPEHAALQREAEILSGVRDRMLPRSYAALEHEGRRYLALERLTDETLEQALQRGVGVDQAISVVLQLVQLMRRLHQAGWGLVGLAPADVRLSQPIRVAQLGSAVRIGETPPQALQVAGYSAPELAHRAPVTGKEEVYTLGAILYRALAGQALPETGAEQGALPAAAPVPGAPQLLAGALAPAEERVDLETFYQRLLSLKQRLGQAALVLEVASGTSVGLNPTRTVNEDSCGYVTWAVGDAAGVAQRALLCVADGMGGMEAGEVASRTALRTILSGATLPAPPAAGEDGGGPAHQEPRLDLVALVKAAATAVHGAALGRAMGTTVTCAEVHDGVLTLAHVGDTRAYLLSGGGLTQLTADHSLVAAMVASGVLTKEEADGHPDSNKVLRSLGSQRELPNGYVDTLEAAYGSATLQLQPGDWLLLCSDGIWGSVPDERITEVLMQAPDCPAAARALVDLALRAGAPDNAAAVVARCVRAPSW